MEPLLLFSEGLGLLFQCLKFTLESRILALSLDELGLELVDQIRGGSQVPSFCFKFKCCGCLLPFDLFKESL